jgi:dolichol-phosphate mannosyltransferase
MKLGIACPMANEVDSAARFVGDVLATCRAERRFSAIGFFAVLDRVSCDGTYDALTELQPTTPELDVIWAPENRSVVDAYRRGYRAALAFGADWILEIDAGYSHRQDEIPRFFVKMGEGYDCVFGSRFCDGGAMRDNALGRRILSRGGSLLSKAALGSPLTDLTSGFQLFSRAALESILQKGIQSRGPFFQTEMKAYSGRLRTTEVPITYRGGNHAIGQAALADALAGLWRLYRLRRQGAL